MSDGRVFVVGSLNADLIVEVPRTPRPGETLLGGNFIRACGGKGANQAVAAARAGATVVMIGVVGVDPDGDRLFDQLSSDGIDTTYVSRTATPTGLAVVYVDGDGENSIVVAPGANADCTPEHVNAGLQALGPDDVVLAQGEIPAAAIAAAARAAVSSKARFVLNLAPPVTIHLPPGCLQVLIVNEHEAAALTGLTNRPPTDLGRRLAMTFSTTVVLTLGAKGALIASADGQIQLRPYVADQVLDTSGAGDAFVGAFAAALAGGKSMDESAKWGSAAGCIAVASLGAQSGHGTPQRIQQVIPASAGNPQS